MGLAGWILKRAGWRFVLNVPPPPKCVVCVAPHTSNWDFVIGELGSRSVGLKACFLMKDTWFFWPLGPLMRRLGGIPVKQHAHTNVSEQVVTAFGQRDRLWVAVTPEGTRSPNANWHKGFLHIAHDAGVPLLLAYIDYGTRTACIDREFHPTGDVEADIQAIKDYYRPHQGRFPEKFAL